MMSIKKYVILIIIGGILPLIILPESKAQSSQNEIFGDLYKYRKWGIQVGPSLYNRAVSTHISGKYSIENIPIPNINFGLVYHYPIPRNWTIISGIWVTPEPLFNIWYLLDFEDLPYPYCQSTTFSGKSYGIYDFSLPILISKNIRINKNTYYDFQLGVKFMYLPSGIFDGHVRMSNNGNNLIEIFTIEGKSRKNPIYTSAVFGGGLSLALKNAIIHTNLYYVHNFQHTMHGTYLFHNLVHSADSYGTYSLSGSYLNLQLAVRWRKSKKKLREIEEINNRGKGNIQSNPFNDKQNILPEKAKSTIDKYAVFKKHHPYALYQNLGLHFSTDAYEKGISSEEYGTIKFFHQRTITYSYGLNYRFFHHKRWLLSTGFWIKKEAMFDVRYFSSEENLFLNYPNGINVHYKQDIGYSYSVPLLYSYTTPVKQNVFADFTGGIKTMYYPKVSYEFYDIATNLDGQDIKIMEGYFSTQPRSIYGAIIVGGGITFTLKKLLIQSKLTYIHNIGNTVNGEYKFTNLLQSPDSGGKFHFTGNHLSLELIFHLKKSKKKVERLMQENYL